MQPFDNPDALTLLVLWATHLMSNPLAPVYIGMTLLALWLAWVTRRFLSSPPAVTTTTEEAKNRTKDDDFAVDDTRNRERLRKRILQIILAQGLDDFSTRKGSPLHLSYREVAEIKEDLACKLGMPTLLTKDVLKMRKKKNPAPVPKLPVVRQKQTAEELLAALSARKAA